MVPLAGFKLFGVEKEHIINLKTTMGLIVWKLGTKKDNIDALLSNISFNWNGIKIWKSLK